MKVLNLAPVAAVAAACALCPAQLLAQDIDYGDTNSGTPPTYQVSPQDPGSPDSPTQPPDGAPQQGSDTTGNSPAPADAGPVRLARFSLIDGDISWRPSSNCGWSPAGVNLPLQEDAQLWASNGGKAEVQFDDGSYLRIGAGAVVTLQTLYSDDRGEFTEIQLNQGLVTMNLKNTSSVYQVDTPLASVKAAGGTIVRVGVNDGMEVAVRAGSAVIVATSRKATLQANDYVYLSDANAAINISPAPDEDHWDEWCNDRDDALADDATDQHAPQDVAVCAGDLSSYGVWREDPQYGWVWCPTVNDAGWRPYEYGHWVDCEPFGWTWCSTEPWGWAPYHYGTWFRASYGWAWCPGPERQYWSPAVVSFSDCDGDVGWCPLAPNEVDYASLSFGFGRGGSFFGFSIGEAGCYYPGADGLAIGFAFLNYGGNGRDHFGPGYNGFGNHNPSLGGGRFVPTNARFGGVMTASPAAFAGSGTFHASGADASSFFAHGQVVGAPHGGAMPYSGPASVRPTAASITPSRTFESTAPPSDDVINRPVFRAPLPDNVARVAPPLRNVTPFDGSNSLSIPRSSSDQTRTLSNSDSNDVSSRANEARQNLGLSPETSYSTRSPWVASPDNNRNVNSSTPGDLAGGVYSDRSSVPATSSGTRIFRGSEPDAFTPSSSYRGTSGVPQRSYRVDESTEGSRARSFGDGVHSFTSRSSGGSRNSNNGTGGGNHH
jgi:hypothetical protein